MVKLAEAMITTTTGCCPPDLAPRLDMCERKGLWAYYFVNREAMAALHARVNARLSLLV